MPYLKYTFNTMRIPSVETLSAECVNAVGDVQKEMRERLDGLKLAIRQLNTSKESIDALTDKANEIVDFEIIDSIHVRYLVIISNKIH